MVVLMGSGNVNRVGALAVFLLSDGQTGSESEPCIIRVQSIFPTPSNLSKPGLSLWGPKQDFYLFFFFFLNN